MSEDTSKGANAPSVEAEILRIVLPLLSKHKIPPNPLNYAVWYEYVARQQQDIKQEVDGIVEEHEGLFPREKASSLFKRYVAEYDESVLNDLRTKIRTMSVVLSREMKSMIGESLEQENELNGFSDKLENADPENLANIVGDLIEHTKSMAANGKKFREAVEVANEEIQTMRSEMEKIRAESETDVLTGLYNRRFFDRVMSETFDAYVDNPEPFSLLIMDIDHFKSFNDEYGHLWGDKVLKHVAMVLKSQLKGKDIVARYGGEEFVVILYNAPQENAARVAETIRHAVEVQKLKKKGSGKPLRDITISLGVAEYNGTESIPELIERADKALYAAKEGGRNQVKTAN